MKKIKSKMLIGLGVITMLTTTGSVVLSCGSSTPDQQKLNKITTEMISSSITKLLAPNSEKNLPDAPASNKFIGISINELNDISIIISNWVKSTEQGYISFSIVSINEGSAKVAGAKFGTITISGYASTDQKVLDGITSDLIVDAITKEIDPKTYKDAPNAPIDNKFTGISINGLNDVSITVSSWQIVPFQGSILFSIVSIDKGFAKVPGAKFGTITISGFASRDQQLLNIVTTDMVKIAITKWLQPNTTKYSPDAPVGNIFTGISINTLTGVSIDVSITITNWQTNTEQGSIAFSIVSINKGIAIVDGSRFGTITIYGYNSTDQLKLNGVTTDMVKIAINALLAPDATKQVPDKPKGNEYNDMILNGLDGVSIRISNWKKEKWFGFLTFSIVSIYKGNVIVPGYKFGTIKVSGFLYTFNKASGIEADSINSVIQTKEGKYFVGTNKGLWISNNGAAYTQLSTGQIYSIYQTSNGDLYVGSFNGLWVSKNGGTTFTQISAGLGTDWWINSIYQTSNGDIYVGTYGDGLFVLRAGGTNFTMINNTDGWFIASILQTSIGDIFIAASGAEGLWRSKNNGASFTQVSGNLGSDWVFSSIYQTLDRNIYVGTSFHGLWVSKDGGSNFNQVTAASKVIKSDCEIQTIYQASNYDLFVGTDKYGLWVSKDDGVNFTQVGGKIGANWDIGLLYQPPNVSKLFIGTYNQQGLWISNT